MGRYSFRLNLPSRRIHKRSSRMAAIAAYSPPDKKKMSKNKNEPSAKKIILEEQVRMKEREAEKLNGKLQILERK